MTELYDEFFSMLRFAKNLYDCGFVEQHENSFGSWQLEGDDYWGLAHETISMVFQDTRLYYNERDEMDTWVFIDPSIDRFCQLCQEYEKRRGICEEENPYRRDMERAIHEGLCFSSYNYGYDWRLSPGDRGRKCLLLFTGCEFYATDEVTAGLLDIKDGFIATIAKLESELSKETRLIPLSLIKTYKEAA